MATKPTPGSGTPPIPKIGSAAWDAAKAEMKQILRGCARRGTTISYSELSAKTKSAHIPYDSGLMGTILGEISTEEDAAGRGMLSVVVVHKTGDTMPGPGFFELAAQLGRDVSDELKLWSDEMRAVQKLNAP